ncbi:MAG: hypothetical protein DRJ68_05230 [Thermoprotei archaeon]|nr:MAG: hypothetical protein DRJ62_03640 [Thermoprotei archaeon]RLF20167.1 MAG: hypothetical protein DRJ68_05230 [Thermoprotei archaeon]
MSEVEKVKEVLRQNPQGLPVSKVAELSGLSRAKASKLLKELQAKGEVTVEVKGCRRTYKLKG